MNTQTYTTADYWLDNLLDAEELRFPVFSSEKVQERIVVETPVAPEDLQTIKEIAGNKELNVLKLFIGALGILLHRYTEQNDVVIAMPPMLLPDVDELNCGTLYCRLALHDNMTGKQLLDAVHEAVSNAYANREYDEDAFRNGYSMKREGNLLPVSGAAFNYHSLNAQGYWLNDHLLVFQLIEEGSSATLRVTSRYGTVPQPLLHNMAESLVLLVKNFPANKHKQPNQCNIVPPHKLVAWQKQFDQNTRSYPDVTVIDLFLQQVKNAPDKIALIGENTSLTYAELNALSMRISSYIASKQLNTRDLLIGVMAERSYMLVATVLGILRAGAAYVPVESDYPEERIRDIAKDANCPLIFTDSKDISFSIEGCEFVQLDTLPAAGDTASLRLPAPGDLAYVMYSSGTTGKPKGIMIEHTAIMNLLFWYNEHYNINEDTRIVQLTNIVIDIAFQEIFSALINGLTLYIPSKQESQDRHTFVEYLNRHRINFIQLIPDTLSEYLLDVPKLKYLDRILCGGDKLSDSLKDAIVTKGYTLYNVYGQTETAIDTVGAVCKHGTPMSFNEFVPNYEVLIMDEHGNACAEYLPGEIWTAGIGLARGYLNQPVLTEQKFVEHPYKPGQRIYRTLDRARRLPDGSIELLGRKDHQVKLRGFRIEPGEIESALETHPGIDAAVVHPWAKGEEKELAAYFVSAAALSATDLRSYLMDRLPAYMIPQHFIQLDKLPLSSSGKIDRKLLPAPTLKKAADYIAPSNATQETLAKIWAEVLDIDKGVVGINSNFFELGGHSLKAVRVISAIEKEFDTRIQLATFFMKPTISELEQNILMTSVARKARTGVNKITI